MSKNVVTTRNAVLTFIVLAACARSGAAQAGLCSPTPEIAQELHEAAASPTTNTDSFDQRILPLQKLRALHPQDLSVHEAYQDWVQRYGIEGHLRALTSEYQVLAAEHPQTETLTYRYLYA